MMEAAAGRDVNGTSPMDVAAEFECRAVVVWSDTVGHWGQAPGINGKREYFSFSFFFAGIHSSGSFHYTITFH